MKSRIGVEKNQLRRQILAQRKNLDPALARKWSAWVQMHFLGAQCYLLARKIALYASFDKEVDTRLVFERARKEGKELYFPRITSPGQMVFKRVEKYEEMIPNRWGILEPKDSAPQILLEGLDLIVVPGVAFDRRGYRLGFGGGYYDRILSRLDSHTITVGFAYGFQIKERIPVDENDQRVKRLVCEAGFVSLFSE